MTHYSYRTAGRYTYRVFWSAEDESYVAVCEEFPSLSWLDRDPVEALRGLQAVLGDVAVEA